VEGGSLERVARDSGADSILQFLLEMGGDGIKHCQKMKRRQRARLGSMGKERDIAWRRDDVGQRRDSTMEGKGWRRHQLG
jgi:hypothetical protein